MKTLVVLKPRSTGKMTVVDYPAAPGPSADARRVAHQAVQPAIQPQWFCEKACDLLPSPADTICKEAC
jgi:hypothetical protein